MSTGSTPREDFTVSEAKRAQALECIKKGNTDRANGATADMHAEIGKAWHLLEEACGVCPSNHRARFLLVSLCMNDDNYQRAKDESETIYQGLTKKQLQDMNDPLLHLSLVHACKMLGDFVAAVKYATEATELIPRDPQPHMVLGELLELTGDHAGAERCCKEALSRSEAPECKCQLSSHNVVFTLSCLAAAQLRLGRFRDAENSARKAMDIDKTAALPLIRLSEVFHSEGRFQEAVEIAEQAAQLDPMDTNAAQRLAMLKRGTSAGKQVSVNEELGREGEGDGNLQPGTAIGTGQRSPRDRDSSTNPRQSPRGDSQVGALTPPASGANNNATGVPGPAKADDGSSRRATAGRQAQEAGGGGMSCLCCFDRGAG